MDHCEPGLDAAADTCIQVCAYRLFRPSWKRPGQSNLQFQNPSQTYGRYSRGGDPWVAQCRWSKMHTPKACLWHFKQGTCLNYTIALSLSTLPGPPQSFSPLVISHCSPSILVCLHRELLGHKIVYSSRYCRPEAPQASQSGVFSWDPRIGDPVFPDFCP